MLSLEIDRNWTQPINFLNIRINEVELKIISKISHLNLRMYNI